MIVQEEHIDLATPSGPMRTYVVRPVARGRYPGLVLFSEIFQRTGPIRRTAAIMAGHGFVVAVPEIFHELEPAGAELAYDQAGADRGNADKIGKPVSAYDADARAVLDHLRGSPHTTGKLGAMGICIGGHLAFRASMNREVLAGACFYPTDIHKGSLGLGGDDSLARAGEIKGEIKARRNTLIRLLARAGIEFAEDNRRRILACVDTAILDRWADNILGAKTIAEVLT